MDYKQICITTIVFLETKCNDIQYIANEYTEHMGVIMVNNKLTKVYAAFRSGCLGNNILETYFPFFVNIICDENWDSIDEVKVADAFNKKYNIPVPLTFVRQVMGIGIEKGVISFSRGKYIVDKEEISKFKFDSHQFDKQWALLTQSFVEFCTSQNIVLEDVENRILKWIESNDERIVENEKSTTTSEFDEFDYAWNKFLTDKKTEYGLFEFVASLSFSNIMKEAVFYSGEGKENFRGLNVYLDSPMVFAVLGMDFTSRVDSCTYLLGKMQNSGCVVQIFEHNLNEIKGILERAAGWAVSSKYDISKANNAVKFFHDNRMNEQAIAEYCEALEDKLTQMGITIKKTEYDLLESKYQEDEVLLYEMIEKNYESKGLSVIEEKKESIMIDVRSIIMVYRLRKGQVSTHIQSSREIMLTLNGTIANVCKQYESIKSINSGHIPACISSDLFGTVMWLFCPSELAEYQKKQLLADCYSALQPSKKLIDKYIETLNMARASGEIDESKFLFMRSHAVVNDALMNVTKGDYARFNDQTYIDVYDEIKEGAEQKYKEEVKSHDDTKTELSSLKTTHQIDQNIIKELSNNVKETNNQIDALKKEILDKKCKFWGWVFTILILAAPYVVCLVIIEMIKAKYSGYSMDKIAIITVLVIITLVLGLVFQRGKKFIFDIVRKHIKNKSKGTS